MWGHGPVFKGQLILASYKKTSKPGLVLVLGTLPLAESVKPHTMGLTRIWEPIKSYKAIPHRPINLVPNISLCISVGWGTKAQI